MNNVVDICVTSANVVLYTINIVSQVIMYTYIISIYAVPFLIAYGLYKCYKACKTD